MHGVRSTATIAMLENRQVIAIDQDRLGIQGTAIRQERSGQVWIKPLTGEGRAVALLNRGATAIQSTTSARAPARARRQLPDRQLVDARDHDDDREDQRPRPTPRCDPVPPVAGLSRLERGHENR